MNSLDTHEAIHMHIYDHCNTFYHKLTGCISGPNSVFFISKLVGCIYDDLMQDISTYSTIEQMTRDFITMIMSIDEKDYRDYQELLNSTDPKKKVKIYINHEKFQSIRSMSLQ